MATKNQTLGEFIIENQSSFKYTSGELSRLINSIRLAAKVVNHEVNKAGLVDIIGAAGDTNIQGEDQQKLDIYANEKFIQTLTNRNIVCGIASEEEDDFITINSQDENHQNKYIVLIDPLDGSSNIDVNVSVGTIFSIYRRVTPVGTPVQLKDFLQNIITNDIEKVSVINSVFSALFTPQGKYLHEFFIIKSSKGFFLDCDGLSVKNLIDHLSKYKLRSKVEIEDLSSERIILPPSISTLSESVLITWPLARWTSPII